MTFTIDRAAEKRMLERYEKRDVEKIMREAAKVGAKAAELSMRPEAPVGTAERLSQYYRREGLKHGTFRKSVRASQIRQRDTIGYVVGPIGSKGFTRHWIEQRTGWVSRAADKALGTARNIAESIIARYSDG
jgi:hypothetical protein